MSALLRFVSRNARFYLVAGLLAGMLLPALAQLLAPWLPQMVALLLLVTALRIGHRTALGALDDLGRGMVAVVALQLLVPLAAFGLFTVFGVVQTPAAIAVMLATSAPAISGSVNLALLLKLDAGRMMQLLVIGTALFPLTALPVLALFPQTGSSADVLASAGWMLAVIAVSAGLGFWLRARFFPDPDPRQLATLDGASVLAFAVIVVALMAPLNAALRADIGTVAAWAALTFTLSYGLQALTLLALRRGSFRHLAGPLSIGAGNRNVALFLVALPPETLAPLMIFVACWQLPMYLTPILLPALYRKALADA